MLAEYAVLRDEILRRYEVRTKMIETTLVATGVIWTAAFQSTQLAPILLVYPVLVLFLALGWASHGIVIGELGKYIRERIEPCDSGLRWETLIAQGGKVSIGWKY